MFKDFNIKLKRFLRISQKFIKYNIRIVFGSRFVYFLLFAILLFATIIFISLVDNEIPNEVSLYYTLIIPAIAIILYPTSYCIQSDQDMKTLELLFGIPDYRYKTWLIRLLLVFVVAFFIILFLSFISHILITDVRFFKMAFHIMFPTIFSGCVAFWLATVLKNGTGAAVVLVILILIFFFLQDFFEETSWYLYLNPFHDSGSMSKEAWRQIVLRNRLYLGGLSIIFLLFGLFNLQKREGFLK